MPGVQVCDDVGDPAVRSAENNSIEFPCCAQVLLHPSFPFTLCPVHPEDGADTAAQE